MRWRGRASTRRRFKTIKDFHHRLCTTRVLDPACGTGNFLYVSLELMKRLEGEVLDALEDLGENPRLAMKGETVSPHQFHGLELNPRAVAIADLVLWIGYLKWQLRTVKADQIAEPILHAYGTIKEQDAILAWDKQELLRDENGVPLSRWDGETMKLHPITGEEIPDPDATVELYRYENPRRADWPEAEFIVGNPPFIGGKDMRAELGDGYAEAAWKARPKIPGGADFVMHFWDEAATRLLRKPTKGKSNPLRRFGFITTNSVTQTFSRRVIERHARAKEPLSLVYAVPDHPWQKAADKAAVRIAMTVAARGEREGTLATVERESGLNTDTPVVELRERTGRINGNLKIGADITAVQPLIGERPDIQPRRQAARFRLHRDVAASRRARPRHRTGVERSISCPTGNGRDLAQRPRGGHGDRPLSAFRRRGARPVPQVYQHVAERVKPERENNRRRYRRENWWLFGENIPVARQFLFSVARYIATAETSKHRFFQFLDAKISAGQYACLHRFGRGKFAGSSLFAVARIVDAGVGRDTGRPAPRYNKSRILNPFPFPLVKGFTQGQLTVLNTLGDGLDAFRKGAARRACVPDHDRALQRAGAGAGAGERLRRAASLGEGDGTSTRLGLVSVLKDIHDDIDRAVFEAYGWADLIPRWSASRGRRCPRRTRRRSRKRRRKSCCHASSPEPGAGGGRTARHRPLAAAGLSNPETRPQGETPEDVEQVEAQLVVPETADGKPAWPKDELDRIRVVRDMLGRAPAPLAPEALSAAFRGRNSAPRKKRVEQVLQTLVAAGVAQQGIDGQDGGSRFFIPR